MTFTQHPLSAAFPAMQADEYQALVDSIAEIGVQNPITLYEGMVIDGWHRYSAANEVGVPCPSVELGDVDLVDFVRAQNKHRRHLTTSAWALIEVSLSKWAHRGRTASNGHQVSISTNAQMAERVGAHVNTIKQAKVVDENATESVKNAVMAGDISVKTAAAVAKLPAKEQNKIAAKGPEALRAAAKPVPVEPPEDDGPSADELAANAAAEAADRAAFNKLMESDDKLATAHAEITRLNALCAQLQQRVNGLMSEKNEAIKLVKARDRQIEKLQKLVQVPA